MANNIPHGLPSSMEDTDISNTRRVTLTRTGVAALFAQSSYDTGEKTISANLTRPVRECRAPC